MHTFLRTRALTLLLPALALITEASPLKDTSKQVPLKVDRAIADDKGVIVQMFQWSWDSIAAECTDFLGPNGYRFVQASPAQEHVQGPQWWTDYQPVSYKLTSKRGNRASYKRMVKTCKAAGVGIIADTLWNHMAGSASGIGISGNNFTHYDYPGIYSDADGDFHHCGMTSDDTIQDYTNRQQVQTCELVHLADLATEKEYVRARLVGYANDLLSLGVEGLRLDAVKHIAATDVLNMTKRLNPTPLITQEVIWGFGEPIQPDEYLGAGEVQEFRYTKALRDAFLGHGASVADLRDLDNRGWIPADHATAFVLNHDTERSSDSLNVHSPNNVYTLAHVYLLAHPYGHPSILSSYDFSNIDDGAPNSGVGVCNIAGGTGGWWCQHRWPAIAGMIGFRNVVSEDVDGGKMVNWTSEDGGRVAFGRGTSGFVVINNADSPWGTRLPTSLPPGKYCDITSGRVISTRCEGVTYTISSDHTLTALIPPRSALGFHVGDASWSPRSSGTKAEVIFGVTAQTALGENIYVAGSVPELGEWDATKAILLSPATFPTWIVAVALPANSEFEYKYVRKGPNGQVVWESDPNRKATTPVEGASSLQDTWR